MFRRVVIVLFLLLREMFAHQKHPDNDYDEYDTEQYRDSEKESPVQSR